MVCLNHRTDAAVHFGRWSLRSLSPAPDDVNVIYRKRCGAVRCGGDAWRRTPTTTISVTCLTSVVTAAAAAAAADRGADACDAAMMLYFPPQVTNSFLLATVATR